MTASATGGNSVYKGAIIRGDSTQKQLSLVFTGHEFGDGLPFIIRTLREEKLRAAFFFTGDFYRNASFAPFIRQLKKDGHYLGAHSDKHLLYCDWNKRDSLLTDRNSFAQDLLANYRALSAYNVSTADAPWFLPPYEWYNDTIAAWTNALGFQLINFTPGTRSTADYTYPGMSNYVSTAEIEASILRRAQQHPSGLNGFILLVHAGTDPRRTDKLYHRLPQIIRQLRQQGYQWVPIGELLQAQ